MRCPILITNRLVFTFHILLLKSHIHQLAGDVKVTAVSAPFSPVGREALLGEKDMTEIRHVDEVLKLLTVISGDKRYYEVTKSEKGKVKNMCEVAERLVNKGIEKGIQKGLQKGIDQKGIQVFLNCIARGMSREDAQAIADISDSLVEKALCAKSTGKESCLV